MPVFWGTAAADVILGSAGADQIYGQAGNDTLYGSGGDDLLNGGLGNDLMGGGLGNDVYYVAAAGDAIVERVGEGTDSVLAWISYQLAANVEALILQGATAINGTGNGLNNTIIGNAGSNVLNGGAGSDTLAGGKGDDIYDVDSAGDRAQEAANEGYDRVRASVGFTLGANLEELSLTGTAAINGAGNALANTITGNAGNNLLNGAAGDDLLIGGKGNDIYYVAAAGDRVVEQAGEGLDQVVAWISHQLAANVENLTLVGTADLAGTGNALKNTIIGNAGNNVLNGGAGSDTMAGGKGNDVYDIDSTGDRAQEAANEGYDRVRSSVSFELGANVEELSLTGTWDVAGIGNGMANAIIGNTGSNSMEGYAGNDRIVGNSGNDRINGGNGLDYLYGDDGNDTLIVYSESEVVAGEVYDGGSGVDTLYILTDYATVDMTSFVTRNIEKIDSAKAELLFYVSQVSAISSIAGLSIGFKSGGYIDFRALEYLSVDEISLSDFGNTLDLTGVVNPHDGLGLGVRIQGGGGRDVVQGPDSATSIYGGAGDDLLSAGSGGGFLDGGVGSDVLVGGAGADTLRGGTGKDRVSGGGGDDVIAVAGRDYDPQMELSPGETFDGGNGRDLLAVGGSIFVRDGIRASVDLSNVVLLNIENIVSIFSVTQLSIAQLASISTIQANALKIEDEGEIVLKDFSLDVYSLTLSDYGNSVTLPVHNSLYNLLIYGGLGNDVVAGGDNGNTIYGGGGNDRLVGGVEWDHLYGDSGNDVLIGGEGWDDIVGGSGNDLLTGGWGGDSFRFGKSEGVDTISDFTSGLDNLYFENLLHGEFAYRGSAAFTSRGNSEARFADGQVLVDADGNGVVDIMIKLTGITSASQLQASDFVFS